MVPHSITYAQLIEIIFRFIFMDFFFEFDIKMKLKLKTFDLMSFVPIFTDDDVNYFLNETISRAELNNSLCITYKRK